MGKVRNILFIMSDQLRADYLSCAGHPSLPTPNIDGLARRGVMFSRAYTQAPVCGPSRMSFYTGRYCFSHGATWNFVPLPVGEATIGDFLRPTGMRVALVGKTHMAVDVDGMTRLGILQDTNTATLIKECGFEPFWRDDGEHPDQQVSPYLEYNTYLRSKGYEGDNPWHEFANSAQGADGEILSGWFLRNAGEPARLPDEFSETAYTTDRALAFLKEQRDDPWCLHLSYIKPHWPYIVSPPYHDMFGQDDRLPLIRDAREREEAHPVYAAFMNHNPGQAFSREEVCAAVVPTYMGLVKQLDDHLGRLFRFLEESGRFDDTLIVFTSDHGDYLGDHWLGEKEMFHDQSARIPMIVCDPEPDADATRGTVDDRFVEAIDLAPTFLEAVGAPAQSHIFEGRSLLPLLRSGETVAWRDHVFSELDYAFYKARLELGKEPDEARCFMIRTDRWKYVHFMGYRPQLFDLENDPDEFVDLGADAGYADVRAEMHERLFEQLTRRKNRIAISDEDVVRRTDVARSRGVIIGEW